jgi:hypothetical protein
MQLIALFILLVCVNIGTAASVVHAARAVRAYGHAVQGTDDGVTMCGSTYCDGDSTCCDSNCCPAGSCCAYDGSCSECETEANPSENPTAAPFAEPSMNPTEAPSDAPTMQPTADEDDTTTSTITPPTMEPSMYPVEKPSDSPSMQPSHSPSMQPTVNEDDATTSTITPPTMEPTAGCYDMPTLQPVKQPTDDEDDRSVSTITAPTMAPTNLRHDDDTKSDDDHDDDADDRDHVLDLLVSIYIRGINLVGKTAEERDAFQDAVTHAVADVTDVSHKHFRHPKLNFSSSSINASFHVHVTQEELGKALSTAVSQLPSNLDSYVKMGRAFIDQMFANGGQKFMDDLRDRVNNDPRLADLRNMNISFTKVPTVTVSVTNDAPTSGPSSGGWWSNKNHKIALGAAVGGAMVIGVISGAGYYVRQRQTDVVKVDKDDKARKMSSGSTDDGSANDVEMAHSTPSTPNV